MMRNQAIKVLALLLAASLGAAGVAGCNRQEAGQAKEKLSSLTGDASKPPAAMPSEPSASPGAPPPAGTAPEDKKPTQGPSPTAPAAGGQSSQ